RSFAATDGPPATAENSHYLTDTVTISNGATSSNLVNINLTVSWQDYVGPLDNLTPAATTTTEFRSGFSSSVPTGFTCTDTVSPITCTTPKSLGPGKSVTYTLVFRTAFEATSGTSASAMKIHADVAAKEQTNTNKVGKNAFQGVEGAPTSYEGSPDQDI